MNNYLNYNDFQKLAMKHYEQGGDHVVECWDERDFNEYVREFGEITEKDALELFEFYVTMEKEALAEIGLIDIEEEE